MANSQLFFAKNQETQFRNEIQIEIREFRDKIRETEIRLI